MLRETVVIFQTQKESAFKKVWEILRLEVAIFGMVSTCGKVRMKPEYLSCQPPHVVDCWLKDKRGYEFVFTSVESSVLAGPCASRGDVHLVTIQCVSVSAVFRYSKPWERKRSICRVVLWIVVLKVMWWLVQVYEKWSLSVFVVKDRYIDVKDIYQRVLWQQ